MVVLTHHVALTGQLVDSEVNIFQLAQISKLFGDGSYKIAAN